MEPGSVAAPTAGLHYDEELLSSLTKQGLPLHRLTLHVGAGTFKPLSEGEVASHTMHAERCVVTRQALLDMAQQTVRVATGTTTLRTMESLYWWALHWKVYGAWPDVLPQRSPYGALAKKDVELGWSDQKALTAILDHGPWQGDVLSFETQLMIVPGYSIRMVKGLVTNFHQPGSTLLCLVAAFVGMEAWQSLYKECLAQGYRFLSYGDGSLLWLGQGH
jgi:S-adenosylmethionine:tRNA ribosyltransferase-isomerase